MHFIAHGELLNRDIVKLFRGMRTPQMAFKSNMKASGILEKLGQALFECRSLKAFQCLNYIESS